MFGEFIVQPLLGFVGGLMIIILVIVVLAFTIVVGLIHHSRNILETERKFGLLFNRVFDALFVMDNKWRIINVNDSACKLLGYSRSELDKFSLRELVPPDRWPELEKQYRMVFDGGEDYLGEARLINRQQGQLHVEAVGASIKIDGRPYILAGFRDITARKKAEVELLQKNIAMRELFTQVEEEKTRFKRHVADNIDHVLLPTINKLINDDNSVNEVQFGALKSDLRNLASVTGGLSKIYAKLTPREIEICSLIKNGAASKDISRVLNISLQTVNKHREKIRRKLVINKRDTHLAAFLQALTDNENKAD